MFKNKLNLRKVATIVACLAVTSLIFSGCKGKDGGDGDDGGNNGGGVSNNYPTDGRLTITGLAEYNNYFVIGAGAGTSAGKPALLAADEISNKGATQIAGKISNGSVTLKVWKTDMSGYKGNDTYDFFAVQILKTSANVTADRIKSGTVNVTFSNGIATGVFEPL